MLFEWNNKIQNGAMVVNLSAHFIEWQLNKNAYPVDLQLIEPEHLLFPFTQRTMLCPGTRRND